MAAISKRRYFTVAALLILAFSTLLYWFYPASKPLAFDGFKLAPTFDTVGGQKYLHFKVSGSFTLPEGGANEDTSFTTVHFDPVKFNGEEGYEYTLDFNSGNRNKVWFSRIPKEGEYRVRISANLNKKEQRPLTLQFPPVKKVTYHVLKGGVRSEAQTKLQITFEEAEEIEVRMRLAP